MNRRRLFLKYAIFVLSLTCLVLISSAFVTHLINRLALDQPRGPIHIAQIMAEVVPELPADKRDALLEKFKADKMVDLKIVKSDDVIRMREESPRRENARHPAPVIAKLKNSSDEYIVLTPKEREPMHMQKKFLINFSVLFMSVLFSVVISLAYVLYTLREKAGLADKVLLDLQHGNLKARIPVGQVGEFSELSERFNTMAEEIEGLVENLKLMENTRKSLMRQLAHDLRTPIAALKSLVETLRDHGVRLTPEKQAELFLLALKEINYFSSLVDDLLFLGEVQEPKYSQSSEVIDVRNLFEIEIEGLSNRYPGIEVVFQGQEGVVELKGDRKLLNRLIRNSLENAFSFAKSRIQIHIHQDKRELVLKIEDDGPGMDEQKLKDFGVRKPLRTRDTAPGDRISVGLGAIIMHTIVEMYRGYLKVENKHTPAGNRAGLILTLTLHS